MTRKEEVLQCVCRDYGNPGLLFGNLDIHEKTLISKNTIRNAIRQLKELGLIERDMEEPALPRVYHWYRLTPKGQKQCQKL